MKINEKVANVIAIFSLLFMGTIIIFVFYNEFKKQNKKEAENSKVQIEHNKEMEKKCKDKWGIELYYDLFLHPTGCVFYTGNSPENFEKKVIPLNGLDYINK